jgi:hypothetical protein
MNNCSGQEPVKTSDGADRWDRRAGLHKLIQVHGESDKATHSAGPRRIQAMKLNCSKSFNSRVNAEETAVGLPGSSPEQGWTPTLFFGFRTL